MHSMHGISCNYQGASAAGNTGCWQELDIIPLVTVSSLLGHQQHGDGGPVHVHDGGPHNAE